MFKVENFVLVVSVEEELNIATHILRTKQHRIVDFLTSVTFISATFLLTPPKANYRYFLSRFLNFALPLAPLEISKRSGKNTFIVHLFCVFYDFSESLCTLSTRSLFF